MDSFNGQWKDLWQEGKQSLTDELQSNIEIIYSAINSLNPDQLVTLDDRVSQIIGCLEKIATSLIGDLDFYENNLFEGIDYGLQAGIEDPKKREEYYNKAVESEREMKKTLIPEISQKLSHISIVKTSLRQISESIKESQFIIPGVKMENNYNQLVWDKKDTDLLELVTALFESASITNASKSLTRKEAIEVFSNFFGIEIKNAESLLTRATQRKKDVAPFLSTLKKSFEDYAEKKDKRLDTLRK